MTDELISSPQLLKLYQSQLIMLLMSAQARALQCCLLPTRRHTHTQRDRFFLVPIPPIRGCHQWLLCQHVGATCLSFTLLGHPLLLQSCASCTSTSWRGRPSSALVSAMMATVGSTNLGFRFLSLTLHLFYFCTPVLPTATWMVCPALSEG